MKVDIVESLGEPETKCLCGLSVLEKVHIVQHSEQGGRTNSHKESE